MSRSSAQANTSKDTVLSNVVALLSFINSFITTLGEREVEVNTVEIETVCKDMMSDFPHAPSAKLDPFFQVANFVYLFCTYAPIKSAFHSSGVGELARIENHQNAIVALALAFSSLEGATIEVEGREIVLKEAIELPRVVYGRLVEAIAVGLVPSSVKLLTVLFESLALKQNAVDVQHT